MLFNNPLIFIALLVPALALLWLVVWLAVRDRVGYLFSLCGMLAGVMVLTLSWLIF